MKQIIVAVMFIAAGGILFELFTGTPEGTTAYAGSKLRCSGPYQVIKGQGKIATPYCEDGYLAKVARGYGMNVSARSIRQNPHKKDDACRLVGHDNRVSDICSGHRDESDGRR